MEKTITLLIPALLTLVFLRAMFLPARLVLKVGIHSACGLACLWLMNLVAPISGIYFPVNAVTVLIAGFLGLPGMGLLALLAVL